MLFDVVVLTIFSCNKDKSWPPRSGLQMTLINDKFVVRWSCQVCMFYLHIWQITCLEGLFQIKYQTNLSLKLTLKEFEKVHYAGIISYLWTWYLKPFYQFCNLESRISYLQLIINIVSTILIQTSLIYCVSCVALRKDRSDENTSCVCIRVSYIDS